MPGMPFLLDPRLEKDTLSVCEFELCRVLLMNDRRYPWLILVPRLYGAVELTDLSERDADRLWDESLHTCRTLKAAYPRGKLNVGTLGTVVSQLHLHHVVRHEGDAAWPGPVSEADPYEEKQRRELAGRLAGLLEG